ncbi:SAF domain-containing protein [Frankia sp. AiPs1]|uniref:SAF domain-containing protein n=1 Tax=Frankia sp. AiPa1 TaxID=573492 RepID=UPI00202B69DE|nr:SAF domain-containing protein [Frankia sp. AiPa1]MCL9760382.1 SAF domain-containing protein [Frankia sp. AiPa1]
MTELAAAVRTEAPPPPGSPPARRLTRRRWRDSRLLVGVLLVLVSVVVGARLFASADSTQQWVVARGDLPAGHVVVTGDLGTVSARLSGSTSGRYYPGARLGDLTGATLARPVNAGEFVSGGDFAGKDRPATRLVPVIVKAGRLPVLEPGDHVDVYVFQTGAAGAGQTGGDTAGSGGDAGRSGGGTTPAAPVAGSGAETLALHDVEFVEVEKLASGDRSITLRVPIDGAIQAVAASQSERVDVVKLERDARGGVGAAGPTTAAGFGR